MLAPIQVMAMDLWALWTAIGRPKQRQARMITAKCRSFWARDPRAEVEVLQAQRAETESSRADLQLAVAQAQRDLDMTVLRAPFDGTLSLTNLTLGRLVSANEKLADLVDPDEL